MHYHKALIIILIAIYGSNCTAALTITGKRKKMDGNVKEERSLAVSHDVLTAATLLLQIKKSVQRVCLYCSYTVPLKRKHNMDRHVLRHLPSALMPFSCKSLILGQNGKCLPCSYKTFKLENMRNHFITRHPLLIKQFHDLVHIDQQKTTYIEQIIPHCYTQRTVQIKE